MSSFGQTLRQAREAKGLTPSLVAKETHILVQIISDMENEDFHRIPAPIYGRGFVRLYAECVGLDPLPLIREFMDIYEGRRAPTVLVREVPVPEPEPVLPEPEPVLPEPEPIIPEPAPILPEPEPALPEPAPIFPEPEPVLPEPAPIFPESEQPPVAPEPEQPAVVRGLELFEQTPQPTPMGDLFPDSSTDYMPPRGGPIPGQMPPPEPTSPHVPFQPGDASTFVPSYEGESGPTAAERFRQSLSSVSHGIVQTMRGVPRRTWRIGLLALGALAVVALIVFGCIKLYQATSTLPRPDAAQPTAKAETKGGLEILPTDPPQTSRKNIKPPTNSTPKSTPVQKSAPAKPGQLRSTGQKVPPLYLD